MWWMQKTIPFLWSGKWLKGLTRNLIEKVRSWSLSLWGEEKKSKYPHLELCSCAKLMRSIFLNSFFLKQCNLEWLWREPLIWLNLSSQHLQFQSNNIMPFIEFIKKNSKHMKFSVMHNCIFGHYLVTPASPHSHDDFKLF